MNWQNLLDNQCPKCEVNLEERDGFMICLDTDCDFKISLKRFEELKSKIEDDELTRDMEGGRWE